MGLFAQIISIIVIILGIPCGMIVGWIAKEELKEGKEYFIFLESVLLGLMFFFLLHYRDLSTIGVLAGITAFALFSRFKKIRRGYVVYLIFLVILLLSRFYIIEASLMFIYGIPYGSVMYMNYYKKIRKLFRRKRK